MASLEPVAAALARDKAAEGLASAEAALESLDVEILTTRADLERLDALTSVTASQLTTIENVRRKLRMFMTEHRPAALAAVETARAALETAEREVALAELHAKQADLSRAEEAIRAEVVSFARSMIARLSEHKSAASSLYDLAERCGASLPVRWSPLDHVAPGGDGRVTYKAPGPGAAPPQDARCAGLFAELGTAYLDEIESAVKEERAVREPPPRPPRPAPDPISDLAWRRCQANAAREKAERERAAALKPLPEMVPPSPPNDFSRQPRFGSPGAYTPGVILVED